MPVTIDSMSRITESELSTWIKKNTQSSTLPDPRVTGTLPVLFGRLFGTVNAIKVVDDNNPNTVKTVYFSKAKLEQWKSTEDSKQKSVNNKEFIKFIIKQVTDDAALQIIERACSPGHQDTSKFSQTTPNFRERELSIIQKSLENHKGKLEGYPTTLKSKTWGDIIAAIKLPEGDSAPIITYLAAIKLSHQVQSHSQNESKGATPLPKTSKTRGIYPPLPLPDWAQPSLNSKAVKEIYTQWESTWEPKVQEIVNDEEKIITDLVSDEENAKRVYAFIHKIGKLIREKENQGMLGWTVDTLTAYVGWKSPGLNEYMDHFKKEDRYSQEIILNFARNNYITQNNNELTHQIIQRLQEAMQSAKEEVDSQTDMNVHV